MLTLYVQVPTTRRKTVSHVLDDRDQLLFSSGSVAHCIAWIYDQGEMVFAIVADDFSASVEIHSLQIDRPDTGECPLPLAP